VMRIFHFIVSFGIVGSDCIINVVDKGFLLSGRAEPLGKSSVDPPFITTCTAVVCIIQQRPVITEIVPVIVPECSAKREVDGRRQAEIQLTGKQHVVSFGILGCFHLLQIVQG